MSVTYKSNAAQCLRAIETAAIDALEQATYQYIYEPSQQIVPLDEGPLQESGQVTVEGLTIIVSYSTDYAIIQHENLQYAHAPGRQAKYLEMPFRAAIPQLINAVKNAIE